MKEIHLPIPSIMIDTNCTNCISGCSINLLPGEHMICKDYRANRNKLISSIPENQFHTMLKKYITHHLVCEQAQLAAKWSDMYFSDVGTYSEYAEFYNYVKLCEILMEFFKDYPSYVFDIESYLDTMLYLDNTRIEVRSKLIEFELFVQERWEELRKNGELIS